jgi:DNA-3-methyladenine glycosylase
MHWCANVVAAEPGRPEAVLLRAREPVSGEPLMKRRRGGKIRDCDLARGPANLCKALGITGVHNGVDLTRGTIFLRDGALDHDERIVRTPRIGVDYAGDDARRPWRFLIHGSRCVSRAPRS